MKKLKNAIIEAITWLVVFFILVALLKYIIYG